MQGFLAVLVMAGLVAGCSEKKPTGESEPVAAGAGNTKTKDQGPLTDVAKESLKDCGDGTWLHGEGDVTKLDSGCDADGYAEILTSEKYRLIVDAILFEGHLWLVVDSKERDLHVVRFANGQDDLEDIDEAE